MTLTLGRFTVLVLDIDKALNFYVGVLGMHVVSEQITRSGREAIYVGYGSISDAGIWLMPTTKNNIVGNQADGAPLLTIFTNDLGTEFNRMKRLNVVEKDVAIPHDNGTNEFFHVFDPDGNPIVIMDTPAAA